MVKKFSVLIFILSAFQATAQFKNSRIATEHTNLVHDPAAAINPKNPANVILSTADGVLYCTFDGGLTWEKKDSLIYPTLVASPKGEFYRMYSELEVSEAGKKTMLNVDRSKDGGKSWDTEFSDSDHTPYLHQSNHSFILQDGSLYVTWTAYDQYGSNAPDCQSKIFFSTSKSDGKKWSRPVSISQTPGTCIAGDGAVGGAMPVVLTSGKIFVAWANRDRIYFDRSYDGDLWLSNDIAIEQTYKTGKERRYISDPVFISNNAKGMYDGALYMAWDETNGTDSDVWFIRSYNGGDIWTTPLQLANTPDLAQFKPRMAIDASTGVIYLTFFEQSSDLKTDVYLAYSLDGGSTFTIVKVNEQSFLPGALTGYSAITANGGIVAPVWIHSEGGNAATLTAVIKQSELVKEEEPPAGKVRSKSKK